MPVLDLWQRFWDHPEPPTQDIEDSRISIHAFWGMVQDWEQGYETQANVLAAFNIAGAAQLSQAQTIKQHINAAPDKTKFIRMCKNWSYVAQSLVDVPETDKYRDFAAFTQRMADEVTAQGGTPP